MSDFINSCSAPEPVGHYPHAKKLGNLLFLSGVGPRKRNSKVIPGVSLSKNGDIISYDIGKQCVSVFENIKLKTGDISTSHMTGKHTTTFAEMFDMDSDSKIIDSPGIKGFGLVDFKKEELALYFPEMIKLLNDCKFHNCKHINEPGCKVLEQLNNGELSSSRYQSYISMYEQDPENNYRQNIHL